MLTIALTRIGTRGSMAKSWLLKKNSFNISRSFTFISKHFEVNKNDLSKVLKDMKSLHRAGTKNNIEVRVCNLCDKDNKENIDNIWKLNIFQNGGYHCFRCNCSGGWFDLKDKVKKFNKGSMSIDNGFDSDSFKFESSNSTSDSGSNSGSGGRSRSNQVVPKQKDAYSYTRELFPIDINTRSQDAKKVLHYLTNVRGLSENVLLRYGVGSITQEWPDDAGNWQKYSCVTFPWFQNKTERPSKTSGSDADEDQSLDSVSDEYYIHRIKLRAIETKGKQRMIPKGGGWGFFGWHTVNLNIHTDIIITEGEYDAMAVSEALSMLPSDHPLRDVPTVSLPNGCSSFPPDLIPLLEQFRRIYLWLDDDKSGREGCEKLAGKLGKHRCWIVQPLLDVSPRPKDANDALRMMKPMPESSYFAPRNDPSPTPTPTPTLTPASAPSSSTVPPESSPPSGLSQGSLLSSNIVSYNSISSHISPQSSSSTSDETIIDGNKAIRRWVPKRRIDSSVQSLNSTPFQTDSTIVTSYNFSTNSTKSINEPVWGIYKDRNIIAEMIEAAIIPRHHRIEQFSDRKEEVIASILSTSQGNERVGTQTPSLDPLCGLVKGFRRGELVVFTGPTGSGKTTLLSQLSIDFAKEGVPTLWGSFEIKNLTLMKKMLTQYHPGQDIKALRSTQLRQLADDFEALPLSFMNFHGASHIDEIIEAIDFCIYRDDVEHIIIDNLQFMMPRREAGVNMAMSKFDMQDIVVDRLRKLATEKNVNVILVVHPRKEQDDFALGISSIFGTAKATQEADVVLILQNRKVMKENVLTPDLAIDVRKNRYDGHMGSIKLAFNTGRSSFYAVKEEKK